MSRTPVTDAAPMRSRRVPIHDPAPRIARAVPTHGWHGVEDWHPYHYGASDPRLRPEVPRNE